MQTQLRPLTLSEILDRTAQLYRENFWLFAGIFAPYAGVQMVMGLLHIGLLELVRGKMARYVTVIGGASSIVQGLVLILLAGVTIAALSRAVAWLHVGERATIRGAYASAAPRVGRYLWLMAITAFRAWLPLLVLYGGLAAALVLFVRKPALAHAAAQAPSHAPTPDSMVIGIVVLIFLLPFALAVAYALWMNLRYALAVPACVVEDLKARAAIRRSIALTKGSRGRIFVLLLLIGVIKMGLVGITQSFLIVITVKQHGQISPAMNAVSVIIAFFTNTFLGPIGAAGLTLFYYDQRIRKEGYDIEWMMQAAGLTPAAAVPESQSEWPHASEHGASVEPQSAYQQAALSVADAGANNAAGEHPVIEPGS